MEPTAAADAGRMVQLSQDIVDKIAFEYSNTFSDIVNFAGVSRSWRSAALDPYNCRKFRQLLPGLLVTGGQHNNPYEFVPFSSVSSMSGLNKNNNPLPPPPTLRWSPPRSKTPFGKFQCVASKDGWLVLIQPTSTGRAGFLVHLFNPITGAALALTPLSNFAATEISKVILSCSPEDDEECCVFILFHSAPQLACCKPGGGWVFPTSANLLFESLDDAAYSSGKLYVVDNHHGHHRRYVHILDRPTTTAATISSVKFSPIMMSSHSAESMKFRHVSFDLNGQLLILIRHLEREIVTFRVYRLLDTTSSSSNNHHWEEVKSFEGYALFLGQHESLCQPVAADNSTIRPNSIYFAFHSPRYYQNDTFWRWHVNDCGIFTLDDQKLQRFSPTQQRSQLFFWFLPMPLRTNVEKVVQPVSQATAKEDEHDENVDVEELDMYVTPRHQGHNKFRALLLLDENEDDDSDD